MLFHTSRCILTLAMQTKLFTWGLLTVETVIQRVYMTAFRGILRRLGGPTVKAKAENCEGEAVD